MVSNKLIKGQITTVKDNEADISSTANEEELGLGFRVRVRLEI